MFGEARAMLAQAEQAVRQAIEYAGSLYDDLEHLDALTAQVVTDYKRISASCQEADAKSTALAGTAGTLEQRLKALHEIGSAADEGRAAVEQLADEVAGAATAFEWQRHVLESGVAEAVRVTGQLTELERRATRLMETDQPFSVAASNADRLEQRAIEAAASLEEGTAALESQRLRIRENADEVARLTAAVTHVEERLAHLSTMRQPVSVDTIASSGQEALVADPLQLTPADLGLQLVRVGTLRTDAVRAAGEIAALEGRLGAASSLLERATSDLQSQLQRIDILQGETTRLTQGLDAIQGRLGQIESGVQNAVTRRTRPILTRLLNTRSADVRLLPPWPLIAGSSATLVLVLGSLSVAQRQVSSPPPAQGGGRQVIAAAFTPPPVALPTTGTYEPPGATADPAAPAAAPDPEPPSVRPKAPAKAKVPPVRARTAPTVNQQAAPVFVGALNIGSMPEGADVFVNHQYVGQTPLSLASVPAGSQVVRIEHEGYRRWTASVRVAAKKREQVSAKLEPIAAQ